MSQPLDVAYVEIRTRGDREAVRDVRDTLNDIERDVESSARDIENTFKNALTGAASSFEELSKASERARDDISRDIRQASESMADDVRAGSRSAQDAIDDLADAAENDLERIRREARRTGREIDEAFRSSATTSFTTSLVRLRETTTQATNALGNAVVSIRGFSVATAAAALSVVKSVASIAGSIAGFVVKFGGISALIPVVLGLGGAVLDLAGAVALLPAAVGVLASIQGALAFAFRGIGEALEALAKGDLEEIKEAMEDLPPAARRFARELNSLRQPLLNLQQIIQTAFFNEFNGSLTQLAAALLPLARRGLREVASALGDFGARLVDVLSSREAAKTFFAVFQTAADIINRFSPSIVRFVDLLLDIVREGLPAVETVFNNIAKALDTFNQFLTRSLENGQFQQFIDDFFASAGNLFDLLVAVGDLLLTLFGRAGDEGRSFVQVLTDAVNELNDFLQTAEGQQALQDLIDSLPAMLQGIRDIAAAIPPLVEALQKFNAAVALAQLFLAPFVIAGDAVVELFRRISSAVHDSESVFANLPANIQAPLTLVVDIVRLVWETVQRILVGLTTSAVNTVTNLFGGLPGRIGAVISPLIGRVQGVFTSARTQATLLAGNLVSSTASTLSGLPGRAASALAGFPGAVNNALRRAVNGAVQVGRDIMNGVANGITQGASAAVNAALNAASRVLRAVENALGIGSPSRVFAAEVGAPIAQGIGVGVNDEIDSVSNSIALATQRLIPSISTVNNEGDSQSLVFGPGSVQVTVMGSANDAQARAIGNAVGSGIINTVTRRQVQLRVRTI